jgi:hypothetical protein
MRKKLKISTEEQRKLAVLEPIVAFAKDNRGFVSELTRRLARSCVTDRPISTMHVGAWLRADPEERVQPRLGMGLILIDAATKLMAEWPGRENGKGKTKDA